MIQRMSKDEFMETVTSQIKDHLPEEFQKASVRIEKVLKDGDQIRTGVLIQLPEEHNFPLIYLDMAYSEYLTGADIGQILKDIAAQRLEYAVPEHVGQDIQEIVTDPEAMKARITYRLVNAEDNKELLKERPHTDMGEMAFIYQVELGYDSRLPLDKAQQEKLGLSTEEIHQLAEKNSPELLPAQIRSISEVLGLPGEVSMLVVTNQDTFDGAAAIFYPGVAETIRDRLGGDFYVLPSSVDEVFAVPVDDGRSIQSLEKMIRNGNSIPSLRNDKLADHVMKLSDDGRALVPVEITKPVKDVHRSQDAR